MNADWHTKERSKLHTRNLIMQSWNWNKSWNVSQIQLNEKKHRCGKTATRNRLRRRRRRNGVRQKEVDRTATTVRTTEFFVSNGRAAYKQQSQKFLRESSKTAHRNWHQKSQPTRAHTRRSTARARAAKVTRGARPDRSTAPLLYFCVGHHPALS